MTEYDPCAKSVVTDATLVRMSNWLSVQTHLLTPARTLLAMFTALLAAFSSNADCLAQAADTSPDYVATIQSGHALVGANPAVREALLAIAGLANEFGGWTDREIFAVPDIHIMDDDPKSRYRKMISTGPDGTQREFAYDVESRYIQNVAVTKPDKTRISISFRTSSDRACPKLSGGTFRNPSNQNCTDISFDHKTSNQPHWAIQWPLELNGAIPGRIIGWDTSGNCVLDCEASGYPTTMRQHCLASASVEQLDALDVSAKERLRSSSAYQNVNLELRLAMDSIVGWSDGYIHASPNDLPKLPFWQNPRIAKLLHETCIEYRVTPADPSDEWSFFYDRKTDRLRRAEKPQTNLGIYFEDTKINRLIGGRAVWHDPKSPKEGFWLLSFHPGKVSPRIAVATTAAQTPDCLANGKFYVWSLVGDVFIEQAATEPIPISVIVQNIEATLTKEQKNDIGWRGAKEADYLLGTY